MAKKKSKTKEEKGSMKITMRLKDAAPKPVDADVYGLEVVKMKESGFDGPKGKAWGFVPEIKIVQAEDEACLERRIFENMVVINLDKQEMSGAAFRFVDFYMILSGVTEDDLPEWDNADLEEIQNDLREMAESLVGVQFTAEVGIEEQEGFRPRNKLGKIQAVGT